MTQRKTALKGATRRSPERLAALSLLVRGESMRVNAEFAAIECDPETYDQPLVIRCRPDEDLPEIKRMTKWEYQLDEVTAGQIKSSAEDVMNGWGRRGWELVNFTPLLNEADTYICVFKRPLED